MLHFDLFSLNKIPLQYVSDLRTVSFPPLQRGTSASPHIVSLPEGDFVQWITLIHLMLMLTPLYCTGLTVIQV
jgi:hypothetical protein